MLLVVVGALGVLQPWRVEGPHGAGGGLPSAFEVTSPDGSRTAWVAPDGRIHVRDARTGRETAVIDALPGDVTAFRFTPDGSRLVVEMPHGKRREWDLEGGGPAPGEIQG
jgi:WD40 repeat protein